MSEQEQFLSILREILEQYSLIFKVIHEIDKTIGEGNRELRDRLTDLESVLRQQIETLVKTATTLSNKSEEHLEIKNKCEEIHTIVSGLDNTMIRAGIIVGGICTILGGVGIVAIHFIAKYFGIDI